MIGVTLICTAILLVGAMMFLSRKMRPAVIPVKVEQQLRARRKQLRR